MHFKRLKDLRESRGLSQKQLGEVLGIKQTVYSRYERGVQRIPCRHLIMLADFYKIPTDYILGLTDVKSPHPKNIS